MSEDKKKNTPDIRLQAKVLMVEVKENEKIRRFFTPKKNFQYLIEFSRICNARLVEVRAERVEVLTLRTLVQALNDPDHQQQEVTFEELVDLTPRRLPFCRTAPRTATAGGKTVQSGIQFDIRSLFISGQLVKIKDLVSQFEKYQLSDSTIRRYFQIVKNALEDEGYKILKTGRGAYYINKSSVK